VFHGARWLASSLTLSLAVVSTVCGQPADPSATGVPDALRAHLRSERFSPLANVAALPAGLRDELNNLFGGKTLELADPGTPFQATDVMVTPRLPPRRLTAAGCSPDHCLVYYERGGFAHVHFAALFEVSSKGTRFEFGGLAPGGLADLDAVKNAIAAGKVLGQKQTNDW
jgi:hypothetical protein